MNILNRPHQAFTEEKAKEVAAILNADEDDDLTYTVKVAEVITGPYFVVIEARDEDGEFVAFI